MATVHTEYGPGKIIDQDIVRGRRTFKVAGEGFEVWVDESKLGAYQSPGVDLDAPHWDGHDLGDQLTSDAFGPGLSDDELAEYQDPRGHFDRDRMRTPDDYDGYGDDDLARYSRRMVDAGATDDYEAWQAEHGENADRERSNPVIPEGHRSRSHQRWLDQVDRRLAWAPMDNDNSTDLPYNPDPQHHAIGTPGDEGSATIQPIHHIDADERLRSSDSISFDDAEDDDEPGPNPDLFAHREAVWGPGAIKGIGDLGRGMGLPIPNLEELHNQAREKARDLVEKHTDNPHRGEQAANAVDGAWEGAAAAGYPMGAAFALERGMDAMSPTRGGGWGGLIRGSSRHEATPAALAVPLLRTLGPMALNGLMGGGEEGGDGPMDSTDPGDWGGLIQASYRPAGLSDKYIDITAGADYHNDPVAQFRHDPQAYIDRIGHVLDEGLNPRFAEYMDLVEGDSSVRTAAWKDVRKKAMRLKTSGAVHVQDIAPNRIMASVDGDHGTYDVLIYKASSNRFTGSNQISNWHCACEWGKWAYRRKFTFVGRLCSHAYASYLTMQSAHMRGKSPQKRNDPRNRPVRALPFDKVKKRADNLQNGPERLTPELVVNDTDDAHMFLDVTKDERKDVGPDDVMSDKDIVHFARLMRHCEVTEQPYPRHLVAFLARYADCNDGSDDTQADYKASDATDANEYLNVLRSDADRKQEKDFGSMAERVHKIQDAVEEARAHGADADRFVAMVRKTADPFVPGYPGDVEGETVWDEAFGGKGGQTVNKDGVEYTQNGRSLTKVDTGNDNPGGRSERSPEQRAINRTGPGGDPRGKQFDPNGYPTSADDPQPGQNGFSNRNRTTPSAPAVNNGPAANPGQAAPAAGAPAVGAPGAGGAAGGPYTAPSGGQTSGTIADGGVAGAENGDNSAITKGGPNVDANGMYTVQKGDTWSDIAQRTTGDMNNYQKMYDQNKDVAGGNIDSLAEGTQINLKDYLNDTGNGGVSGDVTNPAGGGADGDIGTLDTTGLAQNVNATDAADGKALGLNAGTSIGVDTSAADSAGSAPDITPPGGDAASAVPPPAAAKTPDVTPPTPAAPANGKASSLRTAKDWLRWAAEGDAGGTTNETAPTTEQAADASTSTPDAGAGAAATPATNPAAPGTPSDSDVYDPNDPSQQQQQSMDAANPGAQAAGSSAPGTGGMDMSGIGDTIGGIASGIGGALPGLASGIGGMIPGLASGIGNAVSGIFSSKQDVDDWRRYAYPAGGGDDFDPETLPHIPFAGSGSPGPTDFGTSEEYADKARKKMDDVTELGDALLSTPMGDWQKQGGYTDENQVQPSQRGLQDLRGRSPHREDTWRDLPDEDEDGDPYREASIGYSTDDDSDVVRTFQAHLGETALGAGAGQGAGRFDDLAGAAQGFLRTAGRNYSLAEQSELIREGDKGGARNLASLDLAGTHYEEMDSLGW